MSHGPSVDEIELPDDTIGAFVGSPTLLASATGEGPLTGTTLGVKDLFEVVGTVNRAGNPDFAADRPVSTEHASAVARLLAAGTNVVGRTVSDELAFSLSGTNVHDGQPVNVAAPGRVPGGSSAGSAAAVAAGLVDLGLGTDTGGSIRVPASYCGIFGWRSSHGSVPLDGVVPLARSFDTVGLFARRPERLEAGARALLDVASSSGRSTGSRSVRVLAEAADDVDASVGDEVARVAAALGVAGRLELGIDMAEAFSAFRVRQFCEAWQAHGEWISTTRPRLGPGIAARFAMAEAASESDLPAADALRATVAAAIRDATADGTVLLAPAAAGAAPVPHPDGDAHEQIRARTLRLSCLAGLAGAPVVVIPAGRHEGLPLGIAAIGAPGDDLGLLSWAVDAHRSMGQIGST